MCPNDIVSVNRSEILKAFVANDAEAIRKILISFEFVHEGVPNMNGGANNLAIAMLTWASARAHKGLLSAEIVTELIRRLAANVQIFLLLDIIIAMEDTSVVCQETKKFPICSTLP